MEPRADPATMMSMQEHQHPRGKDVPFFDVEEDDSDEGGSTTTEPLPDNLPPRDPSKRQFPMWFLPFIGHVGVGSSSGLTFDFAGPYFINKGSLAFGRVLKFWQLDPAKIPARVIQRMGASSPLHAWNLAVEQANQAYKRLSHNICCQNCHHHVARVLSILEYDGQASWSQAAIAWRLVLKGRFVSTGTLLQTYIPFIIIVCAVILLAVLL